MKTIAKFSAAFALAGNSFAQFFEFTPVGGPALIPDGVATGYVDTQTINSFPTQSLLTDVNVQIHVSGTGFGGFNGDLYAYLQHDSGLSVLLNRSGVRAGSPFGYSDNGLNVRFDDESSLGDIHNYRLTLNGSHNTPLAGLLTGTWAPDARNFDPAAVLDTSPRTADLASFVGLPANGNWSLFIADLSEGDTHQLESWSLQLNNIPEPQHTALGAAGALLLAGVVLRFRKKATEGPCSKDR